MNMDEEIIQQALKAFEQRTGFKGTWHPGSRDYDGTIDLIVRNSKLVFFVEAKKYVGVYHLDKILKMADLHQPLIVAAENIAVPVKDELQSKGISYLEANGNAYIDKDPITILIAGNKPLRESKPVTNRAFTKTGLKAVFHLLNDTQAIKGTYRQLAEETGLALGNIKYIIDGLHEAGFIIPLDKRKMAIRNKKVLLDRWIAGYRETLKPDLLKGKYKMWKEEIRENWQAIDIKDLNIQWGGEAAAEIMTNHLKANVLTIFTPAFTGRDANTLWLVPDKNSDVEVYEKFWRDKEASAVVPALLVYADLLLTEDPRCIETANIIYQKHLKDQIETD
jgi:hypothetical protein